MKVEQGPNLSPAVAQATESYQNRHERGRAARQLVPRGSHAEWCPCPTAPTRSNSFRRRPGTGSRSSCRSGTGV